MLTATDQSITLHKPRFCILPKKLTYTFVKRKNIGLVLLFKAHYSREHQASHSTRKHLRSQSVPQAFTSSLSLDTSKSPRWHWARSCCSLARAQVRDWGWHSTSCTHLIMLATAPTPAVSYQPYALSFLLQRTPNQEHLQEYCSFILSAPPSPSWSEALVWCRSTTQTTHHCTLGETAHTIFFYQVTSSFQFSGSGNKTKSK